MYYEWHNKQLNKENSLFLTILNYVRQILVTFKYFVQSDWRIIVKNMELPYNVKLKTQVVTDKVLSGFKWDLCCSIFSFLCSFLQTTVYHFVLFRLAIALHSDNSFGIYKKKFLSVDIFTHHYNYPNYQIYFHEVNMPHYFVWVYSILMQVKTLFITLVSCMLLK